MISDVPQYFVFCVGVVLGAIFGDIQIFIYLIIQYLIEKKGARWCLFGNKKNKDKDGKKDDK